MPQSYTLEFKKKIVRLHEEEGRTYKSILQSMAYPKPASLNGVENSAKNVKPKPWKIPIHQTNLNL